MEEEIFAFSGNGFKKRKRIEDFSGLEVTVIGFLVGS